MGDTWRSTGAHRGVLGHMGEYWGTWGEYWGTWGSTGHM